MIMKNERNLADVYRKTSRTDMAVDVDCSRTYIARSVENLLSGRRGNK